MIRAVDLHRHYKMGDSIVRALDGVNLHIPRGSYLAITGASGSGKSTLMHLMGCLDRPSSGTLQLDGQMISTLPEKQIAKFRNQQIGFVFQTFNLINRTTALDNVCVPLMYTRKAYTKAPARDALERVGLAARAKHRPSEMSGGECQRVAIARAIVNNPSLLLADEPTGNLDSKTSEQIMQIFDELHDSGMTIVLVTHEMDIAARTDRMIHMHDGKIVEDTVVDETRRREIQARSHDLQRRITKSRSTAEVEQPRPPTSTAPPESPQPSELERL